MTQREQDSQPPQALIDLASARVNYEGGRFLESDAIGLSQSTKDLIDNWIVQIGHPLALEPGTQVSRIVALAIELANGREQDSQTNRERDSQHIRATAPDLEPVAMNDPSHDVIVPPGVDRYSCCSVMRKMGGHTCPICRVPLGSDLTPAWWRDPSQDAIVETERGVSAIIANEYPERIVLRTCGICGCRAIVGKPCHYCTVCVPAGSPRS